MNSFQRDKIRDDAEKVFGVKLSDDELNNSLNNKSATYGTWYENLTETPVKGLKDECLNYIRHWGNGGGRYSTQICVEQAVNGASSDEPKVLAEAILSGLADSRETTLESSILTMCILDDSMLELGLK